MTDTGPPAPGPRVVALYVYPVKSCAGIALPRVALDEAGVRHDRRFLVVDADGRFVSQRERPEMSQIRPAMTGDRLTLRAPGRPPLELPLEPDVAHCPTVSVRIWHNTVPVRVLDGEAGRWVSDLLGGGCRLGFFPPGTIRAAGPAAPEARVGFADSYPLHLVSRESLVELNRRLEQPIEATRFRPNVVVDGVGAPHAEDHWRVVALGQVHFDVVAPCARCTIPNVHPDTGATSPAPTRALAAYRRRGGDIVFGQNLAHRAVGTIRVGDPVTVVERGG